MQCIKGSLSPTSEKSGYALLLKKITLPHETISWRIAKKAVTIQPVSAP